MLCVVPEAFFWKLSTLLFFSSPALGWTSASKHSASFPATSEIARPLFFFFLLSCCLTCWVASGFLLLWRTDHCGLDPVRLILLSNWHHEHLLGWTCCINSSQEREYDAFICKMPLATHYNWEKSYIWILIEALTNRTLLIHILFMFFFLSYLIFFCVYEEKNQWV